MHLDRGLQRRIVGVGHIGGPAADMGPEHAILAAQGIELRVQRVRIGVEIAAIRQHRVR